MRYDEALRLIHHIPAGFRVHFERIESAGLCSDYVPNRDEEPFGDEEKAWRFAADLAAATVGKFVNFYVVDAVTFVPVPDYSARKIANL
jgi:hypothetical protein